ncbi:MAG TPA: hypothetical protein VFK05_26275 [Polyangiaceae bacterium]|nr:hypothetical protein [Polyangiaceae bacterium]
MAAASLVHCGGRTGEFDPEAGVDAAASGGGAGDDCNRGEPSGAAPFGGEGGLEAYARLRTASGGASTTVNRSGMPVSICHHIK